VVTLIISTVCVLGCSFLIYVLLQFRRELNLSSSPQNSNSCNEDFDSADWRLRHIWADRMAHCGEPAAKFQDFQLPSITVPKRSSSTAAGKQLRSRKSNLMRKKVADIFAPAGSCDVRHTPQYVASPRGLLSFASLGFMDMGHAIESGDDRGSKKGKSNER